MERLVKRVSKNAQVTDATHIKPESKTNVISVLPPERKVKYDAWANASSGIEHAQIIISPVAVLRTESVVLYKSGIKSAQMANSADTARLTKTENAISFTAVSIAFVCSLAPKS